MPSKQRTRVRCFLSEPLGQDIHWRGCSGDSGQLSCAKHTFSRCRYKESGPSAGIEFGLGLVGADMFGDEGGERQTEVYKHLGE